MMTIVRPNKKPFGAEMEPPFTRKSAEIRVAKKCKKIPPLKWEKILQKIG